MAGCTFDVGGSLGKKHLAMRQLPELALVISVPSPSPPPQSALFISYYVLQRQLSVCYHRLP